MGAIEFVVLLLVFTALFTPLVLAIYILRSIDLAAKRRQAKVNFFIVDLFSLIFLIQIPFVMMQAEIGSVGYYVVIGFSVIASMVVWWVTIRTVSQAGIMGTSWRLAISVVVIPSTFIGSFFLVGSCFVVWWDDEFRLTDAMLTLICLVGLIASFFITRVALTKADQQVDMGSTET